MHEEENHDPLEGVPLLVVFRRNGWNRENVWGNENPVAVRFGHNPSDRDERRIMQELTCAFDDPLDRSEEEYQEDAADCLLRSIQDAETAKAIWELKFMDPRPGRPFVYDEEVQRAERYHELMSALLDAVGHEYEKDPNGGLIELARRVRETGFHELARAEKYVRRFRELSGGEFDLLRMELLAFKGRRVQDVDTHVPLRLACECRLDMVAAANDEGEGGKCGWNLGHRLGHR